MALATATARHQVSSSPFYAFQFLSFDMSIIALFGPAPRKRLEEQAKVRSSTVSSVIPSLRSLLGALLLPKHLDDQRISFK